ncbi:solute carrier family 7 (cationic amino acid transporter), member 1 [Mytilus galloprovincialis]|uniref:Solute carrier family 7 (Cationic amino acid transporter), member 1 n=2 Tax=Mytilus galloprovincialis TaxID=29158 RepID=A0A8B6F1U3_MYTGA|nr:solute carrier family 7 (cationic amino acid transporter), member 1 [Mytilus galloprovincialis]
MEQCKRIFQAFGRRKNVDPKNLLVSRFRRNLNIFDLIGIGMGGSLGIGVYIVISYVIKHQAGPSAVLSVIIAGVAAVLSGFCYSEFTTRLPQAGSSYVFVYASLGELSAFVIGWSMILENIVLAAVTAKAWGQYFDGLLNGTIHSYTLDHLQWTGDEFLTNCPDILPCGILFITSLLFVCNAKASTLLSFILTTMNGLVIICIICVGIFHVRHENWTDPPGFFPFGLTGIIAGAGTLFCIFTGIDSMCSSSEETREPIKTVPRAIITSNILTFVIILCVTLAVTLSYPWYNLQDSIAIPTAYQDKGVNGSFYVFAIGGLLGLTAALISSIHGIPRLLFSMKMDRLLYPCCLLNPDTGGVLKLTIFPLLIACILSMFVTLNMLIQMLALGSLVSYTCVAVCVLHVRYQPIHVGLFQEYEDLNEDKYFQSTDFVYPTLFNPKTNNGLSKTFIEKSEIGFYNRLSKDTKHQLIMPDKPRDSTYHKMDSVINDTPSGSQSSLFQIPPGVAIEPSNATSMTSSIALIVFIIATTVFSFIVIFASNSLFTGSWWATACFLISVITLIVTTIVIVKQPQNQTSLLFKTPYVPFVPLLVIFINMLMMSLLSYKAWLRFSIWLFLGLIVYFIYGIRHSTEIEIDDQEVVLYEITDQERTPIK